MKFEKITLEQAKTEYKWIWKAFKAQFPSSNHESTRAMTEVAIAILKGHVRNEDADDEA